MKKYTTTTIACLASLGLLSACGGTIKKLENVGSKPPLNTVSNPQTSPNYKPVTWPMPEPERHQAPARQTRCGSRVHAPSSVITAPATWAIFYV